jgi:hypothetical protein
VGDALVAQIPALLISVAAAMVVSRVGKEDDGTQIASRCSAARTLAITGHHRRPGRSRAPMAVSRATVAARRYRRGAREGAEKPAPW